MDNNICRNMDVFGITCTPLLIIWLPLLCIFLYLFIQYIFILYDVMNLRC